MGRLRMALLLGCIGLGIAPRRAEATLVNLVVNGEFEAPLVPVNNWSHFPIVTGWATTDVEMELWAQGFLGSPALGSDGLITGQHLELNYFNGPTTISQTFVVPPLLFDTNANFSFDAWTRGASTGQYRITGSLSGTIVGPTAIISNGSVWSPNTALFAVIPGETITLWFSTLTGDSSNAVHIDQVRFWVNAVPEPATVGLAGFGLAVLLAMARRRAAIGGTTKPPGQ